MQAYHSLTEIERNQIWALNKNGLTQRAIAEKIGVQKTTIFRELHRSKGLGRYRPKQAHRLASSRQAQIPRTRIWMVCGL
jgi:IS30 family transposase